MVTSDVGVAAGCLVMKALPSNRCIDVHLSGDTLRQALKDSKVDAHGVDKNVDSISRAGNKVTVELNKGLTFWSTRRRRPSLSMSELKAEDLPW